MQQFLIIFHSIEIFIYYSDFNYISFENLCIYWWKNVALMIKESSRVLMLALNRDANRNRNGLFEWSK